MYAVGSSAQNSDVVEALLKRKADVNVQTVMGVTPLLLAAQFKHS
jgi:ankyrin repeat protein